MRTICINCNNLFCNHCKINKIELFSANNLSLESWESLFFKTKKDLLLRNTSFCWLLCPFLTRFPCSELYLPFLQFCLVPGQCQVCWHPPSVRRGSESDWKTLVIQKSLVLESYGLCESHMDCVRVIWTVLESYRLC